MANEENLIPAKPGEVRNPNGRPKGSLNLATRIQKMLDDDEFTTELVSKGGKRVAFKGNPAEAIIKTAILKSMSGDEKWANWLAKNGYGTKQVVEFQTNPVEQILEKYGLKESEDGEKNTDARETTPT